MSIKKSGLKRKKYPFWYYAVMFLIPILLLITIEVGLRIIDYGNDYTTFVKISEQYEDLLFFNPVLPQKYFSSSVPIPSVIPDGFDKQKKENSFRAFVLGGSSAAGFPYPPNASFSRYLKRKLQLIYPENKIEIINLAVSAVNTVFIRDIINDVLDQSPDLIIFYAGHNEYYGSYGAASNDLTGYSPEITRLTLWLKQFKIYQLFINTIDAVNNSVNSNKNNISNKTLMASMAGDKYVEYKSNEYYDGLNQFTENIEYILKQCNENKIHFITATVSSNLKQNPLIGLSNKNHISQKIFLNAEKKLDEGDFIEAAKLFTKAKDEDAVLFRAPSDINHIIKEISRKYNSPAADIDSIFRINSNDGIPGYNLFVDHLHPNIEGHRIIGDALYEKIKTTLTLNKNNNFEDKVDEIDNYLLREFPFTRFDSTFSEIKIELLKNSYPFSENKNLMSVLNNVVLNNLSDSLAMNVVQRKISWEDGHYKLAEYYYNKNEIQSFYKEMNSLIEDKSFDKYLYKVTIEKLFEKKYYSIAKILLLKLFSLNPDEYSTSRLGYVFLSQNNFLLSIKFYNKALKYNSKQPEYYYNLSKAYYMNKEGAKALSAIEDCLKLSPNNPAAKKIREELKKAFAN